MSLKIKIFKPVGLCLKNELGTNPPQEEGMIISMAKEKTTGFYFKMSPEESELFEQRMALTNIKNKSAFIRKMCIDGHVLNLDLTLLNEIRRLLSVTANNVNQMARRVNSGGEVYRNDLAEVSEQVTAIRSDFGKLLTVLTDVANAKPGKRFILPPKITDIKKKQD